MELRIEISPEAKDSLKCLAAIQDNEEPIPQTGYNKFGKYQYSTLGDILGVLRPIARAHKCLLITSEVTHHTEYHVDEDGKLVCIADCTMEGRIQSEEEPDDYLCGYSMGYGMDKSGDKALKANTIGARYVWLRIAGLEDGADPDRDEDDVRQDNEGGMRRRKPGSRRRKSSGSTMGARRSTRKVS
jgi:hypothetical protein